MNWQPFLYFAIALFCLGSYINVAKGLIKQLGYPGTGGFIAELIQDFIPHYTRHLILVRIMQTLLFIISPVIFIILGLIVAGTDRR